MQFRIIARHDVSKWDEWKSHFRKCISPVIFKIHRCVLMFKQKKFVFWVSHRLKGSLERGSERVWDDKGIHLHISTVAELQTAGGMCELGRTWIVNIPSHMGMWMWVRLEKTVTYFVYRKVGNTQCLFGTTQGTPVCVKYGLGGRGGGDIHTVMGVLCFAWYITYETVWRHFPLILLPLERVACV